MTHVQSGQSSTTVARRTAEPVAPLASHIKLPVSALLCVPSEGLGPVRSGRSASTDVVTQAFISRQQAATSSSP